MELQVEIDRLNDEQRHGVLAKGNTVILAGPGSGKTATLVIKIAYLQAESLAGPEGIACITYNNDAVAEFRARLAGLGIYASRRLFLGTVHSFCLNCVLRPYARFERGDFALGVQVARPGWAQEQLDLIIEHHVPGEKPSWHRPTITRFRRAKACGEDTTGFDDRITHIVADYEKVLTDEQRVDFEGIVLNALELVRTHEWIRDLVSARFRWLVVDEYQDLGGPLHQIVATLMDTADTRVFAVGDPDQTIYDFTGANPKYLNELVSRDDVESIRLKFNYRSGGDLILAGQAALKEERGYEPDPNREDRGRVEFLQSRNSLDGHADKAIEAAKTELARGTPAHEIAVFYQRKDILLPELRSAFDAAGIPCRPERDSPYPAAPIIRWLQDAAAWALHEDPSQSLESLFRYLVPILEAAGEIEKSAGSLAWRTRLHTALESVQDQALSTWLLFLEETLSLPSVLSSAGDREDELEAWEELVEAAESGALRDLGLAEFANDGVVEGNVVITTLHSSKGRQFDAVIIPGLTEGIHPPWRWNRATRSEEPPSPRELLKMRRLFYVGFTRARHTVHLVYSKGYVCKGYPKQHGQSRFAIEIAERLKQGH